MTTIPSQPFESSGPGAPMAATGQIGHQRPVAKQILLIIVTFGLYGVYWAYLNHEEIKQHTGEGVGGAFGAVISVVAGVVTLFLLPIEIKKMYERDGRPSPVGPRTAFWVLLFVVPWFVKCQRALNEYWATKGAPEPTGWTQ